MEKPPVPQMLARDDIRPEDPYFYELNRELIDERRAGLDAERARQEDRSKDESYWMRCPKCGSGMAHSSLMSVRLERCPGCRGVFLDRGELQTLLDAREPHRFLDSVTRIFDPGEVRPNLF